VERLGLHMAERGCHGLRERSQVFGLLSRERRDRADAPKVEKCPASESIAKDERGYVDYVVCR
jgi:hypothetical protein